MGDYEIDNLSRLQRTLSKDWDKLVQAAENLSRFEKRKGKQKSLGANLNFYSDKNERKLAESQERAFWNIHR